MTKAIRQGDIMIIPCETIPDQAKEIAPIDGRLIVARGEATGHHHSFPHRPGIALFRDDVGGDGLYVVTTARAPLEHQEHTALIINPGTHKVIRQRTFAVGVVRQVID